MTVMRSGFVLAAACVLGGCTFSDGRGFATVEEAELAASIDGLDGGRLVTGDGYTVALDRAELFLGEVQLIERQQADGVQGPAELDPANPPPGFTFCHGGHCHAEDGRLVDYEDIEAGLGGGGGTTRRVPLATLPVAEPADLLSGDRLRLDRFDPSPELPEGTISDVAVSVRRLELEGTVSGGPEGAGFDEPVPLSVRVFVQASLEHGVSRPLGRDEPPAIALSVRVRMHEHLFDEVDFAAARQEGSVTIDNAEGDDPSAVAIVEELASSELEVTL